MDTKNDLINVLKEILDVEANEVVMDKPMSVSLALDSTEMVQLLISLEKKYNIKFDKDVVTKHSTPLELVEEINKLLPSS